MTSVVASTSIKPAKRVAVEMHRQIDNPIVHPMYYVSECLVTNIQYHFYIKCKLTGTACTVLFI